MLNFLRLALLMVSTTTVWAKTEVEIIVDDNYEPFSYQVNREAQGVYIEVLKAAAASLPDFSVTFVPMPWQRGKKMMEKGEAYALAPAFFHGHDWPYLYPYSLHFYQEKILTVYRSEILATPRKNWPQDFVGLHINNLPGFDGWGGDLFHKLVKEGKIHYEEIRGIKNNILMLSTGRADCILAEEASFDAVYSNLLATMKLDITANYENLVKGPIVGLDPVHIGYSQTAIAAGKYPFHSKFMKQFDIALYQLKKSGEAERIIHQEILKFYSKRNAQ